MSSGRAPADSWSATMESTPSEQTNSSRHMVKQMNDFIQDIVTSFRHLDNALCHLESILSGSLSNFSQVCLSIVCGDQNKLIGQFFGNSDQKVV